MYESILFFDASNHEDHMGIPGFMGFGMILWILMIILVIVLIMVIISKTSTTTFVCPQSQVERKKCEKYNN